MFALIKDGVIVCLSSKKFKNLVDNSDFDVVNAQVNDDAEIGDQYTGKA